MTNLQSKHTDISSKKSLNFKGFTLIELLVVIAIIAILAVIGLTVFSGQQRAARDGRRRSDIQAIAAAMEANYNNGTGLYPSPLTGVMFTSQTEPVDPIAGSLTCRGVNGAGVTACNYCYTVASGTLNCPGSPIVFDATVPTAAGKTYTFCAELENQVADYCLSNQR